MSLVDIPGLKLKTPSVQTLGVLFFGLLSSFISLVAVAECVPDGQGEMALIDRIQDGDTVKLKDGRHVRVLGINTPEVVHGDKPGQALGKESRQEVEGFFRADKRVRIFYDSQRFDRYGRTLAHVYDLRGASLAAHLLRKGMGFHVAIPPNVSLNQCLHQQETKARNMSLGVWSNTDWRPIAASQLDLQDTGFKRITGRVVNVSKDRGIWLELDGPLVIKITSADLKNFSVTDWSGWKGRQVEVRGWITARRDKELGKKHQSRTERKSYKPLIIQPYIEENLELLQTR